MLAASVNKDVGDWAVYIDVIDGNDDHWDVNVQKVKDCGNKVSEEMAVLVFPQFSQYKYRW